MTAHGVLRAKHLARAVLLEAAGAGVFLLLVRLEPGGPCGGALAFLAALFQGPGVIVAMAAWFLSWVVAGWTVPNWCLLLMLVLVNFSLLAVRALDNAECEYLRSKYRGSDSAPERATAFDRSGP
jgi:hypothetical protein